MVKLKISKKILELARKYTGDKKHFCVYLSDNAERFIVMTEEQLNIIQQKKE